MIDEDVKEEEEAKEEEYEDEDDDEKVEDFELEDEDEESSLFALATRLCGESDEKIKRASLSLHLVFLR